MKKFKENIKKAVMLVMAILMINSSVFADNWVTNCGNYKNGDYRATQIVAGNNVKATKSASWTDTDKTTAKVRIELETKGVTDTVGNLKNCDIIFVCDKSRSAYNSVASAYSDCSNFESKYVKDAATKFISGDFKNSGNRVLFMDFAESAFLYKNGKSLRDYGYYYSTYSSSTARSTFSDLYRGTKNSSKTLDNVQSRDAKLNSAYDTIYTTLYNMIKSDIGSKKTDSLFTSDATELSKNIDKAAATTAYRDPNKGNIADSENKQIYTNIDAPLFMANVLLDNRSDNSRKAYIVFFSDGVPDPIGTPKVSAGQYSLDVAWGTLAQDGAKTYDTSRKDGIFSNDRSYLVRNPYPVNYFYKKIADEIGTTGANKNTEIFLIKTGKDTAVENSSYTTISGKGSSIYPIWNYITRGIKTSYSNDSSYPTYPNVPVPDYGLDGSPNTGSYDSNTDYIKVISNTKDATATKSAIDSALGNIQTYLSGSTAKDKKAINLTVKDVINYNDFDIVPNSWKSNVNQSSIKYNSSTKTISWPVNGIKYGEKCADGNWPYIEFQVKIKDVSKGGKLNTNYIETGDKGCTITGDEAITVPSPWLEREVKEYTITEEYYKNGVIDTNLTKKTSAKENTTYTPEVKTISGYSYTSSEPSKDAFKVTGDKTIKHYYISINYTIIEEYYKNNKLDSNLTKKNKVPSNTTYTPEVKSIPEYGYVSSDPSKDAFTVTGDKTIKHYYANYTITEEYYKNNKLDSDLTKKSTVLPNTTYTPEVKSISEYGYVSSDPSKDAFKVTGDKTIKHYYINYTVTEEYYIDNVLDSTLTKKSTVLPNATYTPEVKGIANHQHTNSTHTTAFAVTGDTVIKHYYKSICKVTIKYISDDEKGKVLNEINCSETILKGDTWPSNKTIAGEYMCSKDGIEFGGGYEFVEDNIKIIGKKTDKYKTANLPNNIIINEDKTIEFHYRLKCEYKVRLWVVTYSDTETAIPMPINVKIFPAQQIKFNTEKSIKFVDPNTEETIKGGKYIGNRVIYNQKNPTMVQNDIANLNTNETAKIKLTLKNESSETEDKVTSAVIDFVYKKAQYSVTVNYREDGTGRLLETESNPTRYSGIPENDKKQFTIPKTIKEAVNVDAGVYNLWVYDSIKSDDTKVNVGDNVETEEGTFINVQTDPITKTTVIDVYYKKQVQVVAEYQDSKTHTKITDAEPNPFEGEYGLPPVTETWEGNLNPNLPEKYKFVSRSDEKSKEEKIIAETDSVKVIYNYYVPKYPGSHPGSDYDDSSEAVVCYPTIDKATVIPGETVTITIPNTGVHGEFTDATAKEIFGYIKSDHKYPWNEKFAVSKFVEFPFDVYYDEHLYSANEKILVAERDDDKISEGEFTFVIPEWVEEKDGYVVKAYTSSNGSAVTMNAGEDYNRLFDDENAAYGEVQIAVRGKIYDFTITNLIEDKMWPTSLFKNNVAYKALSAVNGNVGMLPIGQKLQQPDKYNYGIALGSTFFFRVSTIGIKNKSIEIVPKFTYVDTNGRAENVELYSLVGNKYEKLSSNQTLNLQTKVNNEYKQQRTDWVNESQLRVSVDSGYKSKLQTNEVLGKFSRLQLKNVLKTPYKAYYEEKYNGKDTLMAEIRANDKVKDLYDAVSNWYGEYRLPSSTIVMPAGSSIDPNKSKAGEKTEGYVIVSFKIQSLDSSNKSYLEYEDQTVGNQWNNERNSSDNRMTIALPRLIGTDGTSTQFTLANGDGEYYYPVAIYEINNRITSNNYEVAGTH